MVWIISSITRNALYFPEVLRQSTSAIPLGYWLFISSIRTSINPSLKKPPCLYYSSLLFFFLSSLSFFLFRLSFLTYLSSVRCIIGGGRGGLLRFEFCFCCCFPTILYPILSPNYASFYIYRSTRNRNGATQSITLSLTAAACCSHTTIHAIELKKQTTRTNYKDPFCLRFVVLRSDWDSSGSICFFIPSISCI